MAHSNSNDGHGGGAWTSKSLEMGTFLSNGISSRVEQPLFLTLYLLPILLRSQEKDKAATTLIFGNLHTFDPFSRPFRRSPPLLHDDGVLILLWPLLQILLC